MEKISTYLATGMVFIVLWLVAWFAFIRPLLQRYAVVANIEARIKAAEGFPAKLLLWLEAKKTLLLAFFTSAFAAGKAATDQAASAALRAASTVSSLPADAIAPLQDKSIWTTFFNDIWTLHILAALSILTAFLTLKGKVSAAQIVPKA